MTKTAAAIDAVLTEHADLERQLSDPELHGDATNARRVGRRFAQLAPVVAAHRKLEAARGDLEAARELAADDASFAAEVPGWRPGSRSWTTSSPTCSRPGIPMTPTTSFSRSNPAKAARIGVVRGGSCPDVCPVRGAPGLERDDSG